MITILLSHERSGSHLFGEYLSSCSNVHVYDEVCNANAVDPEKHEISFFRFQADFVMARSEKIFVPTYENQMQLGASYFTYLASRQKKEHIVVDVKYGHVRNFDWFWTPLFRRPLLFDIARSNGMQVLHLYRENVVEAALSAAVAKERRIWHSWQVAEANLNEKLSLNIDAVVEEALILEEQIRWIGSKWLNTVRHHSITYEGMCAAMANLDDDTLMRAADFVGGVPPARFSPRLQKLGRHPRDQLSNAQALQAACRKAGLGRFVEWEEA